MALCYVFISMPIFIFKVCWEIPCGGAFCFVETIQLICIANQGSVFYIVWVSTVMNIGADYCFCCFNIHKLSCYVIFRKDSLWRCGVVVITTAQLYSTKTALRFYAGSNPGRGVSKICDGENL